MKIVIAKTPGQIIYIPPMKHPLLLRRQILPSLLALFVLIPVSCALILEDAPTPSGGEYFYPAAPDNNAAYFARVREHFRSCGIDIADNELRHYTATRYITSEPPLMSVYEGTRYLGRTNDGVLYFKPGQYTLTFSRGSIRFTEILLFVEGRNASLAVRKR